MAPRKKKGGSLRYVVENAPLAQSAASPKLSLPDVPAPSLADLEVTVPAGEPVSEEALFGRLEELARSVAEKRERALGEPVQPGDEVCLDILGYANGRLIPFSARGQLWTGLAPAPMLPGFYEGLVGVPVGEGKRIAVTLPDDYPVASLRGASATFLADVRAAFEVRMPDPASSEFLKKAGRGATLDAVMAELRTELEAEERDGSWVEAQDRVLDALLERARVEVPDALVNEEIHRRWTATEAPLLFEKDFTREELEEALAGWLTDPTTRADAARRVGISLVLRAIVQQEKLQLTPALLEQLIRGAAQPFGVQPENLNEALKGDPALAEQVASFGFHLMAVGHVMAQATVIFS